MRLIDADALIALAQEDGSYGYVDIMQISNAPTIDAEPIRRRIWIDSKKIRKLQIITSSGRLRFQINLRRLLWSLTFEKRQISKN